MCSAPTCTKPVHGHGLCNTHYRRWKRHGDIDTRLKQRDEGPDETRWMQKVSVEPLGCWMWTSSTYSSGYGAYSVDGHTRCAHRYIYEVLVGPVPEGLELDHLCRRPGCVNPDHLEPVTHQLNVLRGMSPIKVKALNTGRKICVVDGCEKFRFGQGKCQNHYMRDWRAARKVSA